MLQSFLLVFLGVAAAQASPGPNMFAVIGVALGNGRRAALLVVAGIASGTLVWAAMAALGLGAVFAAVPALLTALKFIGGAYLCYMGFRGLRAVLRGTDSALRAETRPLSDLAAWRRGLFVVLTNPKALLMWLALATFLFGTGLNPGQVLLFGPAVALSSALIYGCYGVMFSTGLASRGYARFWRWIEAAFGTAFGALGLTLLISGIRDLRP
ncbi:LysE family translocator [Devosia sp. Root635]|uniref:LysE family translocator n=1 Tax=Devosia sp. Root635 TaxID=1736575 RepID=UPI0006F3B628|nr:LysE family translocator [Devosia sp. Root635]KRA50191.1 threonine transporter [Devosia sp. Root635]